MFQTHHECRWSVALRCSASGPRDVGWEAPQAGQDRLGARWL